MFKGVNFFDNNLLNTLPFIPQVLNQKTRKNTENKTNGRKEPAYTTKVLMGEYVKLASNRPERKKC